MIFLHKTTDNLQCMINFVQLKNFIDLQKFIECLRKYKKV